MIENNQAETFLEGFSPLQEFTTSVISPGSGDRHGRPKRTKPIQGLAFGDATTTSPMAAKVIGSGKDADANKFSPEH